MRRRRITRGTSTTLSSPEVVVQTCGELMEEHHRAELLRSYGLRPRNRVLLAGTPGNGKTSLAEALDHGVDGAFHRGSIRRPQSQVIWGRRRPGSGDYSSYVRTRGCVLFFDEFDTIGKERGDEHETGEIKRVVSSLLLQVDDLPSHVVVVTATNHPELLDRAVWRSFKSGLNFRRRLDIKHVSSLKKLPHASIFHLGMPREPSPTSFTA